MSEIHNALQDINWLSQRLKGIMALSEEIQDYDRMKDQIVDMDKIISSKKEEVNSLCSQIDGLEKEVSDLSKEKKKVLQSTKTEVDGVLAKNKLQASAVFDEAKQEAAELRKALEAEKLAYSEKLENAKEKLRSLSTDIAIKQKTYDELQASIDKIKAKL